MEAAGGPGRRPKGRPPKEASAAAGAEAKHPRGVKRKKMFARELQMMMYGFGDVANPLPESVDLLEDMVVEYVVEMTQKTLQVTKKSKVQADDILFLLRKDPKRHTRAVELLRMSVEIEKSRRTKPEDALEDKEEE